MANGKDKLTQRTTDSEWEVVSPDEWEPVASPPAYDPYAGLLQATGLSADTRSRTQKLIDRARQWWHDPSPTQGGPSPSQVASGIGNEALMLLPAAAPEKVLSGAGKVALNLAGRTGGALAGAGGAGWIGREAGLTGTPLTAARVAGGAVGFMAPETIGRLGGRGGRFASRIFSKAPEVEAAPEAVVGTSTAKPIGTAKLPPAPTTPQTPVTIGARTAARTATVPSSGVTRVPVPREPLPSDPNLMGSVPREELPSMAARGVPGAANQQRLLGEPIIYTTPEGNPPGSFEKLQSRLRPEKPNISQRTATQGGHAGGGVASEEELARPGRFVKISRSGVPTDQGKTPDFNLGPGEAGYQVRPGGQYELKSGQESPATKRGVEGYAREVYGKKRPQ